MEHNNGQEPHITARNYRECTSPNVLSHLGKEIPFLPPDNQEKPTLYDAVGLFGSTHGKASWRNELLSSLNNSERDPDSLPLNIYNPQLAPGEWDPSYAAIEARLLAESSVVVFRLENKDTKDNSIGSLEELGSAVLSAYLRGQRLIISIEEGFVDSLTLAHTKTLYYLVMDSLKTLSERPESGITLLFGNNMTELSDAISIARKEQLAVETRAKPFSGKKAAEYFENLFAPDHSLDTFFTLGGSSAPSGPFSKKFNERRKQIYSALEETDRLVLPLNQGDIRDMWDRAYNDKNTQLIQLALSMEKGLKIDGILVIHIDSATPSLGAVAEIGLRFTEALIEGKPVAAYYETFNSDEHIVNRLVKVMLEEAGGCDSLDAWLEASSWFKKQSQAFEKWIRETKTNVDDQEEWRSSVKKFDKVMNQIWELYKKHISGEQSLDLLAIQGVFSQFSKDSILKHLPFVREIDAISRARVLAENHFNKALQLHEKKLGENYQPLYILVPNNIEVFLQQINFLSSPKNIQERRKYWQNYKTLSLELDRIIAERVTQNRERKESSTAEKAAALIETVSQSLDSIPSAAGWRNAPLHKHLEDVRNSAQFWSRILESQSGQYLSKEKLDLITYVVAYLHDIFKFIGSPDQQAIPDHELIGRLVLEKVMPEFGFSPEETEFVTTIVGDHENIFKPKNREAFGNQGQSETNRGKALFFVLDTLTNCFEVKGAVITIIPEELKKRFEDLAFRHADKETGKIFLPEWVAETAILLEKYLLDIIGETSYILAPDVCLQIFQSGHRALVRARQKHETSGEMFTTEELARVNAQIEILHKRISSAVPHTLEIEAGNRVNNSA